jgi:hypothetical protein
VADPEARRQCVLGAKAQISTAFFLSIEFQETGLFVIQVYLEAFGRLPTFREFLEDLGAIREGVVIGQPGAFELLAANRTEFLDRFVGREEFRARYDGLSNFGYLRRDPDPAGFQFWLDKLNSVSLPGEDVRDPGVALARIKRAQMVEAFIDSIEYRGRFGPT